MSVLLNQDVSVLCVPSGPDGRPVISSDIARTGSIYLTKTGGDTIHEWIYNSETSEFEEIGVVDTDVPIVDEAEMRKERVDNVRKYFKERTSR